MILPAPMGHAPHPLLAPVRVGTVGCIVRRRAAQEEGGGKDAMRNALAKMVDNATQ